MKQRERMRKWKRAREEDRNSWGCVGPLTTGMHEEAASIPQARGWLRDTTVCTAQQPTCKSSGLPHPRLFWASLPLWWLSLCNHTSKPVREKHEKLQLQEGRRCIVYCLFSLLHFAIMVIELIYKTARSLKQRHLAAVYIYKTVQWVCLDAELLTNCNAWMCLSWNTVGLTHLAA